VDTREKILPLQKAVERVRNGRWRVVAGYFDPLTAEEAKWVARVAVDGRDHPKLLAIILETEESLLPVQARAALVAALRHVSIVAIAQPEAWKRLITASADVEIIEDLEGERRRSEQFVQFILERQMAQTNV
jgi:hypothetical protein